MTVRRVGGSLGTTPPKDLAAHLRVEAGDRLLAVETDAGILLTPYDPTTEEALAIAGRAARRYRHALRELAKQGAVREPRWVPRIVVEALHFGQVREHGRLPGLRDGGSLEAALAHPRHRWSHRRRFDAPEAQVVTTMLGVAAGEITETQLAAWLRRSLSPHAPSA